MVSAYPVPTSRRSAVCRVGCSRPAPERSEGGLAISSPLLETKLNIPAPRRGLVARPGLRERLSAGAESTLTLVSAPAGFGKTTLLAEWLAAAPTGDRSAAWLSLDRTDNEAASFWSGVIAALQTMAPDAGVRALALLQEPQPPPIETVLATLLNDLAALPTGVVLVLDDYHVIDAPEIQAGMTYLLDNLPPPMHLVIATRADPALPLARLRAGGELVEVRVADLRFSPDEAAAYLNDVMNLSLTARDIAALEERTEGWIAALQLAALSMQGRDDVGDFIAAFAGDDRYIVDYLVDEVLERQPDAVRDFLLQTSILARMTGQLCDHVTGQGGGKGKLEALDRGNLFLVALDDRRHWYRYHHLFADVLRAHLLDEQPDRVADLHRRASEWYEDNGEPLEAIRHALAGDDVERAADLIELAIPGMRQARQESTVRAWLEALPDEVVAVRPVLGVHRAGVLLANGDIGGAEARLREAEQWLETGEGAGEDAKPDRRRSSSATKRAFGAFHRKSRSTGRHWPWPLVTPRESSLTPNARSTSWAVTMTSSAEPRPAFWRSPSGEAGSSTLRTVRGRMPERASSRQGMSLTPSAARGPWR